MGNDRRGGGNQQTQPYTPNERISKEQQLFFVLGQLTTRRAELEAVLPPDIGFDRFHATVNQALRNNPDILECTGVSIVNACVKSAYDGLRLDGREAALVAHNVKIKTPGSPDRWEKHAQYFPMVFGLIQQVLRGGMVTAIETDVIHEHDRYRVVRGSAPFVEHEPLLTGDRGKPIAVYSVAVFPNGYRSTIVMRGDEVEDVRKASKSGSDKDGNPAGIWKRWPSEMWKKTVIRRHRKTLPVGRDIVDSEANEEFDFGSGSQERLASPPPRPTRQPNAIEDRSGTESGVPLDMGHGREGELVEQADGHQGSEAQRHQAADDDRDDRRDDASGAAIDLPSNEAEWIGWRLDLEEKLEKAQTMQVANDLFRSERPRIDASPDRDEIMGIFTDRIAELADAGGDN